MAVDGDAATRAAARRRAENPECAFGTAGGSAVWWPTAPAAPKARRGSASPMVEVAGASSRAAAAKALRGAPCSARPMEAAGAAFSKAAVKVQRAARPSARAMAGDGVACMTGAGFARRACMEAPTTAWRMEAGRDAWSPGAPEVRGAVPTAAWDTAAGSAANARGAGRARREAQTTARRTEAESAALGMVDARSLLAEGAGCAPPTGMPRRPQRRQAEGGCSRG